MSDHKIAIDVVEMNGKLKAILPETEVFASKVKKKAMTLPVIPDEETQGFDHAPWGVNDCLPTEIREKIYKVPMAAQAVYRLCAMMYGNGLAYYRNSDLEGEEKKIKRAYVPEIEQWLRKNHICNKWLKAQIADYRLYMNCFSEMILSQDGQQITGLYHKPAEFCRLSTQNPKTLHIDFLLFSPEYAAGQTPQDKELAKIPLFRWYDEEKFLQRLRKRKFAYHSRFETPGILYYARAFWLGLFREKGWVDVSAKVSDVVYAMMNNQVRLKYQILIPESYFLVRYPDWDSYSGEERKDIIEGLTKTINQKLSGAENAYVSISTVFRQDEFGKDMGKLEIIAIDDKVKKDSWVPSAEKADAQIVQGLGLHPSQLGLGREGGQTTSGSGSDQRESFNTGISLNTIDQEIVLEPLNYVAQYNARTNSNWDVTFFIDHTHHTTTNNQESGLQPSETTLEVE